MVKIWWEKVLHEKSTTKPNAKGKSHTHSNIVLWNVFTQRWLLNVSICTCPQLIFCFLEFWGFSFVFNIYAVTAFHWTYNHFSFFNMMIAIWHKIKDFQKSRKWAKRWEVGLMSNSLITKHFWSHLCVYTVKKLNSLRAWQAHTCHNQQHWVKVGVITYKHLFFSYKNHWQNCHGGKKVCIYLQTRRM